MNYHAAKAYILDRLASELAPDLTYHGFHHTLDVLVITDELCRFESVSAYDSLLLRTAALFHDSGFLIHNREHERLGCELVDQVLPGYDFSPAEIKIVKGMIMATKVPQRPQTRLEEIICDADLDYLGREDFYPIGETLYEEFIAYGVVQNREEWNRLQVRFLRAHTYFTPTNIARRKPVKLKYLEDLENLVATY